MNESAQRLLARALLNRDVPGMKAALSAGADPNFVDAAGHTPLMEAIVRHNTEAMACLIEGGAELNPANPELNPVDFALALKNRKFAAWLESRGARAGSAEPTAAEKDLYLAARTGKVVLLERALAAGVHLDRTFGEGTALCHAIFRGHAAMVQALLEAGASPDVSDRDGNNLARRTLEEIQDHELYTRMRSLLAGLVPRLFADGDPAPPLPVYDIDAFLGDGEGQDPVARVHSVLKGHEGPLREHEILFLAAQEAKVNIPWDGLEGWFNNLSDGSALRWAVQGLEAIGATTAAGIVQQAMTVFPGGTAPEDGRTFQDCVSALTPDQTAFLNELDSKFYDIDEDLEALSLQWLRANRAAFLEARP